MCMEYQQQSHHSGHLLDICAHKALLCSTVILALFPELKLWRAELIMGAIHLSPILC